MASRTADARWEGNLQEGKGTMRLTGGAGASSAGARARASASEEGDCFGRLGEPPLASVVALRLAGDELSAGCAAAAAARSWSRRAISGDDDSAGLVGRGGVEDEL